jgi:hypothetical protein
MQPIGATGIIGREPEDGEVWRVASMTLAEAIRAAYDGVSQLEIVRRVTEALERGEVPAGDVPGAEKQARALTQTKLSKWSRGEDEPPKEVIPVIEWAVRRPRGWIWNACGYLGDLVTTVPAAAEMDPLLTPDARRVLVGLYESLKDIAGAVDDEP